MSKSNDRDDRLECSARECAIIVALSLLTHLAFYYLTEFTADDAFITFRYAENLAAGNGFVYNLGQHILGTTTPLYTFVIALFHLIGVMPVYASLIVSLIAASITVALLYRVARYLELGHWSWLVVLTYAFWPRSLVGETCGMESALFTMLVVAAFYLSMTRRTQPAMLFASLAALTRPEGLAVILLVLIRFWYDNRRFKRQWLLYPVTILGSWSIFSWFYFGSLLPNSIPAKLALYGAIAIPSMFDRFSFIFGLNHPLGWLFAVLATVGAVLLLRAKKKIRVEILWVVLLVLFYTFSHTLVFFWYLVPLNPYLILFAIVPVKRVAEALFDLAQLRLATLIFAALGVLTALTINNISRVRYYADYQQSLESCHKAIGEYLRLTTDENDLVAAEDIGYMGYYFKRTILDRDGLVSPEAVPYNREGRFLELILDYNPAVVVTAVHYEPSAFISDQRFLDRYELEKKFFASSFEYDLFRLRQNGLDKP